MTDPWRPVKRLGVGDDFGPLAHTDTYDGHLLQVTAIERVVVDGKARNLYDVTDQYGRTWRTGAERMAGDCYGWTLQQPQGGTP